MSGSSNFTNLPYQARRPRGSRPDKPLPPPPPPPVASGTANDEDPEELQLQSDFENAQGFTSPPSPPRAPTRLPPPPPISQRPPPPTSSTGDGGAKSTADHLHPYISAMPDNTQIPLTLTPLRAHYLKKTLVALQLSHELTLITDPVLGANALGLLGDPFILPDAAKKEALKRVSEVSRQEGSLGDLPFMRFLFHQFLLPFPFLSSAPPSFWSAKVQPFLSSFLTTTGVVQRSTLTREEKIMAESLMSKEEKKEVAERAKLWNKAEKHGALMIGVGIKVVGGEEVVRIGQSELRRIEQDREARRQEWLAKRGLAGPGPAVADQPPPPPSAGMVFEVNVVGVRAVAEKGRVRSKTHEEFLIRTRRTGVQDVYVSRRYGDFKRLSDEIRAAFPDYMLPSPPAKDKTVTTVSPVQAQQYSYYNPLRMVYGNSPQPSGRASPAPSSASTEPPYSATSPPNSAAGASAAPVPLSREKNRLTLRAYLQTVITFPDVINSPVLRSFLLSGPIQLTPAESADVQRRLDGDAVREEGRKRFREEAEKRIDALREGLAQFKGDVLSQEGGLKRVFEVVRRVERVQDLPKAEASVIEWGRISLAATIFQVFVASDTSSEQLASLKRLHGMVPYFVLKGILRISNPMAMIRGVLDLFLARPFGGQSLIQRMFSSSLTEEVRLLAEDIAMVADKIEDPVICQKIEQYAMAPYEIQEIYRKDAAAESVDLLVVILRSSEVPTLSRPQLQRCYKASRAYKAYKAAQAEMEDSDDDMGPEDEDAWLFEDLNLLLKLWTKRREKEGLLALIFEGTTAELLKDIITIFYAPLAQVYKAASIADSLGDLQNFMNDMIRTIEQVDEMSQEDPTRTVQTFIDLVQRHEQSFYTFVHNVHAKGSGLFDSLMAWIELFLGYARDGLPHPVDLEFLLPDSGPQRRAIMAEVDAVAQYHYRMKVAHEEKIRRRFEKNPMGSGPTDAFVMEESDEAELMGTVMANLNLDDAAIDLVDDEESSDESDDDEDEEDDRHSDRSSVRSGQQGQGQKQSPLLAPVPDHFGPNAVSLKHDRRGSNHSGRHSLEKFRNSLDFKRGDKDKDTPIPPTSARSPLVPESPRRSPRPKMSKKKRRRMQQAEAEIAPETKAIEEMRPLFMEILKPLLQVKPLKV